MVNTTPLEDDEQIALVKYLEMRAIKFSAIPNSTYTKSWSVKSRNKSLGLRAGLPDLLCVLPGIGLVFIELKRQKAGVVSDVQKEWIAALNTCPGVEARVCRGFEEARLFIEELCPMSKNVQTASIF